ncbi:MAG: OmpA family protein [Bacteroidota bacterium]
MLHAQGTLESESDTYNWEVLNLDIQINLVDADTKEPVAANWQLKEVGNNNTLLEEQVNTTNTNLSLNKEKKYQLTLLSEKYEVSLLTIDATQEQASEKTIALQPKRVNYQIDISDVETGEGLPFGVVLTNKNRNEVIELDPSDGKEGKYNVRIREDDEYELEVKNPKEYIFYSNTIRADDQDNQLQVKIHKLALGAKIPLYNITFATGSWELNSNSKRELNRIVKLLEDNPTAVIEIGAHTDNVGSAQKNQRLSEKRAQAVFEYLVAKKIFAKRFVAKGYGYSQPIASNLTAAGRAKNRRFELVVLSL